MTARTPIVFVSFVLLAALARPLVAQTPPEVIYRPGPGITNPVLLKEVKPNYTPEAMRLKIEGTVEMEIVVSSNGSVSDVRVTRSLDAGTGLDAEAVRAAREWRFRPATKDGIAVPVYVTLDLAFRLNAQFGVGAYRQGVAGLAMPTPISTPNPNYTPAAMGEKVQGVVTIDVVVGPDGTVTDARILQSLDKQHGLDDEAMAAARKWTFKPGTLNGQPVPVITTLSLTFRLH